MNIIHAEIDREMRENTEYKDTGNLINGEKEFNLYDQYTTLNEELEDETVV